MYGDLYASIIITITKKLKVKEQNQFYINLSKNHQIPIKQRLSFFDHCSPSNKNNIYLNITNENIYNRDIKENLNRDIQKALENNSLLEANYDPVLIPSIFRLSTISLNNKLNEKITNKISSDEKFMMSYILSYIIIGRGDNGEIFGFIGSNEKIFFEEKINIFEIIEQVENMIKSHQLFDYTKQQQQRLIAYVLLYTSGKNGKTFALQTFNAKEIEEYCAQNNIPL